MFESDEFADRSPEGGGSVGLAGLEDMAPGVGLAAVLAGLDSAGVGDAYDLVEVAAACQRLKGWAEAIEIQAATALAAHPICHAPEAARNGFNSVRAAGQLLAPRLGQSPTTATNRVAAGCN
jgi:hypothetical protein